jgi:type IV secretory pathway TrbD component
LLILFSLRPKWSRLGLTGMAVVMLLSALIWIRTLFGVSLIALLALVLLLIRFKGTDRWHSLTLQFIGVQASISVFLSIDYLFTEKVRVSGRLVYSDTGQIAAALFLPYWFWAILLTGLTLWLPAWSLARALRGTGRSS